MKAHRSERFASRQAAAKAAGISKDTWRRAEEGLTVQDGKLAQINKALGWSRGSWTSVAEGGEPVLIDEALPEPAADAKRSEADARKIAYEAARKSMPLTPIGEVDDFVDRFVRALQQAGEVEGGD